MRITRNQRKEKMKKDTIKQKLETLSLVISLSDFTAYEYDQLDIKKDEFLIVTDWNYKDGWVYGHRKDNKNEKGSFPKVFTKICKEDNNGLLINIYTYIYICILKNKNNNNSNK